MRCCRYTCNLNVKENMVYYVELHKVCYKFGPHRLSWEAGGVHYVAVVVHGVISSPLLGLIRLVSRKYSCNRDIKISVVLEVTTEAGSVFQWSTTVTLDCDL